MTIGVVGAGSWGTTLAVHLACKGNDILLWGHGQDQRRDLRLRRENRAYLPGIHFPASIAVVDSPREAIGAPIVIIATPTQFIRSTISEIPEGSLSEAVVVSVSKGIEHQTLQRISQILETACNVRPDCFAALSGPSHAEEVAAGIPTLVVAASESTKTAASVQDLFVSETLRVYRTDDLVGVELGGALKNVIAIAAGIIDGLGMGDNTKAALITRGLAEITRLGVAMGAQAQTFSGLSGLGDLVVTCTSRHSRNRFVGEKIGQGMKLVQVVSDMRMIAEGVTTCESARALALQVGTEVPIISQVHSVLFEDKSPKEAIIELMTREITHEVWG